MENFGNKSEWKLLCSKTEDGIRETTEALEVTNVGCLVKVRTYNDCDDRFTESLAYIPGVKIVMELTGEDYELQGRKLVSLDWEE